MAIPQNKDFSETEQEKEKVGACDPRSSLIHAGAYAEDDHMVTLEFGWRLGNILTPQYAEVDFFAVRFRSDDTEFHVARWTGRPDFDAGKPVYAAGVGYVFDSEDEGEINDKRWDASFTPGLAWTSQSRSNRPYPLSAFYRAAVGYGNPGGNWDLQTAVSSYFRLIDPEYTTDTFGRNSQFVLIEGLRIPLCSHPNWILYS